MRVEWPERQRLGLRGPMKELEPTDPKPYHVVARRGSNLVAALDSVPALHILSQHGAWNGEVRWNLPAKGAGVKSLYPF